MSTTRISVGVAERALELADQLQAYWAARDDTSPDPYDGLSARRLPTALKRHRGARLALVHLHRRCPVNLRPAFGIPPTRNAYTSAHFASACLRIARATESDGARQAAYERLQWLERVQMVGGWAYPFDVQTRTFHYPATTPNVICTAFGANAFLDAAELEGDERALSIAGRAARFVVRELLVLRGHRCWFRYLPDRDELIHNANALAAQVLIRYGTHAQDLGFIALGRKALESTIERVGPDGSLPYGEGPKLAWVDGHHTGFVIEALHTVARCGSSPDAAIAAALERMVPYYRNRLFGPDGWPYQRPDSPYPIDAIAAAQGINVFAQLAGAHSAFAARIAEFALDRLFRPPGTRDASRDPGQFPYIRGRVHTKRVRYARWVDAPLALAFATLANEPAGDGS